MTYKKYLQPEDLIPALPPQLNKDGSYLQTNGNNVLDWDNPNLSFAADDEVVHNFGDETGLAGAKTWTGIHTFTNTTASTSPSTGTIVLSGNDAGIGIEGSFNSGLDSKFNGVQVGMDIGGVNMPSTNTPTSPISGTTVFNSTFSGTPHFKKSTGQFAALQRNMGHTNYACWEPVANSTTVYWLGPLAFTYTGGNLSTATVSAVNTRTRQPRVRQQGALGTNRLVGQYATVPIWTIGTGAGLGGFYYSVKFMVGDNTVVTNSRMFVGLSSSTKAPTNVEPSTLTNCIGIGKGAADTNLMIIYGGSEAQTPIDLGTNFNINNNTEAYLFELYSDPHETNSVHYRVSRVGTSFVVEGLLTAANSGVQLPSDSTLLCHRVFRATTTTTGQVAYEIGHIYLDMLN